MLELTDVLRGGRQCDEDGVEIIMSREACCVAADEIERLHEVLIRSRRTVDQARDHFLAGAEEDGWTLCALRLALDILDEGLGTRISENG